MTKTVARNTSEISLEAFRKKNYNADVKNVLKRYQVGVKNSQKAPIIDKENQ